MSLENIECPNDFIIFVCYHSLGESKAYIKGTLIITYEAA